LLLSERAESRYAKGMTMLRLTTLGVLGLAVGCSGDGRPRTAPALPQPYGEPACSEYDSGSDGTIDEVYTFTYDDDGFEIRSDGVNSGVAVTTYGPDHFYLTYTMTDVGETTPYYEEHLTRDGDGRILTFESAYDGQVTSQTVTYDAPGRPVHVTNVAEDGSTTEAAYEYADDDALVPTTVRTTDTDGASLATYTASDDEHTVHVDIDDAEDGTVDRTQDLKYDDEHRMLESITRAGGQITSRNTYAYTDRGQLTLQAYAFSDGPDDYVTTTQYDGRGWWTGTEVTSPSGQYASSIYREVPKDACSLTGATVARRAHRRPLIRRPVGDPAMQLVLPPRIR
jgi:hypothetical protein